MKFLTYSGLAIIVLAVAATALFISLGPSRFWSLFREPDVSPVTFQTLIRSRFPNDALACPPRMCSAKADIDPPVFGLTAAELRAAFTKVIAAEPNVEVISVAGSQDIYIQRSRVLGFPDVVFVSCIDLPGGRSSLAIYSRSVFGRSDLSVNRARVERWLTRLSADVPPAS